jgi:hypothetical protein
MPPTFPAAAAFLVALAEVLLAAVVAGVGAAVVGVAVIPAAAALLEAAEEDPLPTVIPSPATVAVPVPVVVKPLLRRRVRRGEIDWHLLNGYQLGLESS